VPAWESWSYLFGPLTALAALGCLVLVLRWAFGRSDPVVERVPRRGHGHEYGLLVPVAAPTRRQDAEDLRCLLERSGLRATLADTVDGPRVMVFAGDAARAREVVSGGGRNDGPSHGRSDGHDPS